jgi:Nucleotidyl transferase AbiEii toxin, Type IV TA system
MKPGQVAERLRIFAREQGRTIEEVRALYMMESFLARLQRTRHANDFVLKGGVLMAAFRLRRPTSDIDMQAMNFELDDVNLHKVVAAVAALNVEDGLVFDPDPISITRIRDEDAYSGLRVLVGTHLLGSDNIVKLDVSTGDPINPWPIAVTVPMILGGSFDMRGHPLATVIAEKTVTVLERGTVSTRWRDMMDVRNLALTHDFRLAELRSALEAVANSREVELTSFRDATDGWAEIGQAKWGAWRVRQGVEDVTLPVFGEQLSAVADFMDPVFLNDSGADHWNHASQRWNQLPAG